ncbi:hypothetical protein chiPu_0008440 [Chiloscyllium punctatum]|uniref:Uncharacterized protein n=1 Tax=Chiloscyllium punctatum TaxID=137246 RepID=A0A401SHU9_CHIPU|nr:hypothetical protein [Chiloscyllium punctatum]
MEVAYRVGIASVPVVVDLEPVAAAALEFPGDCRRGYLDGDRRGGVVEDLKEEDGDVIYDAKCLGVNPAVTPAGKGPSIVCTR